jgi:hypothetical protein
MMMYMDDQEFENSKAPVSFFFFILFIFNM